MWDSILIDTRKLGAISALMDGFLHIIPQRTADMHCLNTQCWCDPRLVWPENGDTVIVSHKHKRPPELLNGWAVL